MRRETLLFSILTVFAAATLVPGTSRAQENAPATQAVPAAASQPAPAPVAAPAKPTQQDIYCSGIITKQRVPTGIEVVSGEESNTQLVFSDGQFIYINKGSSKGVKPGDEFLVVRPINDVNRVEWYDSQDSMLKSMGQWWEDEGRVQVVVAQKDFSIARITDACQYINRGDTVLPFEERQVPQLKSEDNFDRFAPSSGKKQGRIVVGRDFQIQEGLHSIIYVNLGKAQGAQAGDYIRFFRYQGNQNDTLYQTPDAATSMNGYGKASHHYSVKELPREVLGEGVILRTSGHSATVLITYALKEMYPGDYCEIE